MLLQLFEKHLNLPAVLVNPGDGGGAQLQVVGQKNNFLVLDRVVNHHMAQEIRTGPLPNKAGQTDEVVHEDIPGAGRLAVINHLKIGVAFHPADKIDALGAPLAEQRVIRKTPVDDNDGTRAQPEAASDLDLVGQAVGDAGKDREIAVMVQEQMNLDRALGLNVFGPGEQAKAEIDDGGVQTQKLVLEPELVARTVKRQPGKRLMEKRLVELPTPVGVGIGQRGLARGVLDPQMP